MANYVFKRIIITRCLFVRQPVTKMTITFDNLYRFLSC